ncbi:glycerophosphodiester phosphodiesterase family protein [Variovorax sp. J2P1-59]|uniref:glycerophosphodiester phosphodiesterase family protein n=1 Tax=Variovorax flavidus TaxID=3053501 RepID=UPI002576EB2E|nr:glycerophosphodiester phosphodiesterase family protein [Variovorax sp. J2P1-59]MDM0075435.1 glycerophosphodiester phosphodiesterase family protein [Variovorax sp. J2P1-59]
MRNTTTIKTLLSVLFSALALTACGGGGSDNSAALAALSAAGRTSPTQGATAPQAGSGNTDPAPTDGGEAPADTTPSVLVIAHRGSTGYLPEHTFGGYELAVKLGADYIEPDLQFTQDGELVAMHDDTLNRTTNVATLFAARNGGYKVSDFTLAEIKTLTVVPTGTAATTYPGFTPSSADPYRVPTFQEVITLAKSLSTTAKRKVGIYPEAKQSDVAMEDKILSTLVANGYGAASSKVFIQSFSDTTISSLHTKQLAQKTEMPLILLGVALTDPDGTAKFKVISGSLGTLTLAQVKAFADGIAPAINYDSYGYPITKDFITQAHAAGLKVHGWTFAKADATAAAAEYKKYLDMGMDGMFSNYADLAVASRDAFLKAGATQ